MASPMAYSCESSIFYKLIDNVLSNWSALKLAIDHGMGGIDSVAKGRWLVGAVEQYFSENSNLEVDEVEDFLEGVLNDEFDTLADDGSVKEIARKFCRFYRLFWENKTEELQLILNSLPVCKIEDDCSNRMSRLSIPADPNRTSSVPQSHPPEITNGVETAKESSKAMEVDEENDGWQVISKDHRRH